MSDHERKHRHLSDDRLVTYQEASEFLGYGTYMLEHLQAAGRLVPEVVLELNGERMYSMRQLRDYYRKWINPDGLSLEEIAAKYGVTRERVYYNFCEKRKIEPVGYKTNKQIYSHEDAQMIARAEGWIEAPIQTEAPQLTQSLRLRE